MKEVVAPLSQMSTLRDARGRYSIVSRRYTELQDFEALAANTEADIVVSNLSGCVTEIIVEAYAHDANLDVLDVSAPHMPSSVRLVCDSVECINHETEDECRQTRNYVLECAWQFVFLLIFTVLTNFSARFARQK